METAGTRTVCSIGWRRPAALLAGLCLAGCVSSTRYKMARDDTPRAQLLNVAFPSALLQATLTTLIAYGGPGSWKREALWDEYVVTLRNSGDQPLVVSAASLVDHTGIAHAPGTDPWKLEDENKALCKEYDRVGVAFVKSATPAVLTIGGIAAGSAALAAATSTSTVTVTILQGPLATITVPTYLIGRVIANHEDRADIEDEFRLRRLALPLTLAPGQTRVGCLFFPMVPNPRSLGLRWSTGPANGESVLPLDFLHGLHVTKPALAAGRNLGTTTPEADHTR
jgi:hypothetical protein